MNEIEKNNLSLDEKINLIEKSTSLDDLSLKAMPSVVEDDFNFISYIIKKSIKICYYSRNMELKFGMIEEWFLGKTGPKRQKRFFLNFIDLVLVYYLKYLLNLYRLKFIIEMN